MTIAAVVWLRWPELIATPSPIPVPLLMEAAALLVGICGALLPVSYASVAKSVDQHLRLAELMQAALEFSRRRAGEDEAFVAALLRSADRQAARVSLHEVVPLTVYRPLVLMGATCFVLAIALEIHDKRTIREAERAPAIEGRAAEVARDPAEQLASVEHALRERRITRHDAIVQLLAIESSLAARGKLAGELKQLMAGLDSKAPRTLRAIRESLSTATTPEQLAQLANEVAEKRRLLDALRAKHSVESEQQRALATLDRHLAEAQRAASEQRAEAAGEHLEQAERDLAALADSGPDQQKIEATAAQTREQLQRSDAAQAAPPESHTRREQNEQSFSQRSQGIVRRETAAAPGGAGHVPDEPDLFHRAARQRVKLERHAAPSALGEGESRSEVIITAAERGFASAPYRDVYRDYHEHAEQAMQRDELPQEYEYYVRRYFALIRPRSAGDTSE